jgi:uncharacterized membrane protein
VISYESTITIARPAAEVFATIVDPVRMDEWTGMSGSRWLTPSPHGAGSRLATTMPIGPFRREMEWEVVDHQPNRLFSVRSLPGGPMDWTGAYELEPKGAGTVVVSRGEVRPNGLLRLLEPLLRSELPREEATELERLKQLVEREANDASPASTSSIGSGGLNDGE